MRRRCTKRVGTGSEAGRRLKLEIPLVGGLGNQLFIFAYGLFRRFHDGHYVQFKLIKEGLGNKTHGCRLLDEMCLDFEVASAEEGGLATWMTKIQRFGSMRGFGSFVESIGSTVHLTEGRPLDAKPIDATMRSNTFFRDSGYFQDPSYLTWLQDFGILMDIVPAKPSRWFQDQEAQLKVENGIAVHVRRTDFDKKLGPGSLSVEYYKRVISEAISGGEARRVVVFSDSIDSVKSEFLQHDFGTELEFSLPPNDSSDLESLALMSKFDGLIMSNSTFSWWAAVTGNRGKAVTTPERWSRHESEPTTLNLAHWKIRESLWKA